MTTALNGQPAARTTTPSAKPAGRFQKLKPFLAPFLITLILAIGNFQFRVLESLWHTVAAIVTSIVAETILSRFATGRWPHIASAYITGISVGILLRTPLYWPYVMCSLLAITSKYALRYGGRHLWNPSNLGVSILLFTVPQFVAPLSQQWGNDIWVPILIGFFGLLILGSLGRVHITITYFVAYAVLCVVRVGIQRGDWGIVESLWTSEDARNALIGQLALLTAPAYLLFMFFMITDPATTPRKWPQQILVTVTVAVVESAFRLGREIHAPYYALFVVFPITNLIQILWAQRQTKPAPATTAAAALPATAS